MTIVNIDYKEIQGVPSELDQRKKPYTRKKFTFSNKEDKLS